MILTDEARQKIILAAPVVAGAALRVLALGGSALTEKEMTRAAASTPYLFRKHGDEIVALLRLLEGAE